MPKVTPRRTTKQLRHNPLAEQILEEEENRGLRKVPHRKLSRRNSRALDEEDEEVTLPARVTQKVLEVAQAQKAEAEEMRVGRELRLEDLVDDGGGDGDDGPHTEPGSDAEMDEEGYLVTEGLPPEDERALALFMPGQGDQPKGQTLADVILAKIKEQERKQRQDAEDVASDAGAQLPPKVIDVYRDIGRWLKSYKSGKLPKAFKVIPSLVNWEEVLALTNPLEWTPAAMYEAVKIFAANLDEKMSQRFFNLVLLPAIRQDVLDHKKLNFHHYRALRKSLYRPAAFFKGILLPLAAESCTLREAVIMSSVLLKASVPRIHVAASLVRLCQMTPWYGTTSILIASLVNKKCALPVRAIETLVAHFCAFAKEERSLPVVWHRGLLLFVQRYKYELNADQRRRLKELLRVHYHESMTAEVRRELAAPRPGEAGGPSTMDVDM